MVWFEVWLSFEQFSNVCSIQTVKFEVIWVGEHMEFKGHEEVLDLVQVVVDEGLLEIFQEGGDDVVRWSWRFGEFLRRWSSFQFLSKVTDMMSSGCRFTADWTVSFLA